MCAHEIIRKAPLVSYVLFVAVLLGCLSYPVLNASSLGAGANATLLVPFGIAFAWQLFTVYHHGSRVLQWVLLCFYVCALALFAYFASTRPGGAF